MTIHLPDGVNQILSTLTRAGHEAYLAGGPVRDFVMGAVPDDFDIATSARPEEVKALFGHTADTGLRHGTVTVIPEEGKPCEVTTFRVEQEYLDSRRPSGVTFVKNLEEDLGRRDFTMNAMAYSERTGLVDLYGGQRDIQKKIIRCVGEADKRFSEDALRILRAVRFACKLGFELAPDVRAAMKHNAPLLLQISKERVRVELEKALMAPHAEKLALLYETGISDVLFPWLSRCMETPQHTKYHVYDVGTHILKALSYAEGGAAVKWAVFLHDGAKPLCRTTDRFGVDHFKGHEQASAELADRVLGELKLDNKLRRKIVKLVAYHGWYGGTDPTAVRRVLHQVGAEDFPDLLQVMKADSMAHSADAALKRIQDIQKITACYEQILANREAVTVKELAVTGNDLMGLGIYGKPVGEMLAYLLDEVIQNPRYNTRETLLAMAKERKQGKRF